MNLRTELNNLINRMEAEQLPASEAAGRMRKAVDELADADCIHFHNGECSLIEVCNCTEANPLI